MKRRAKILLFFFLLLSFFGNSATLGVGLIDHAAEVKSDDQIDVNSVWGGNTDFIFYFFETKKAAKAYKRKHRIKGQVKKQDDGTFVIETKTSSIQIDQKTADVVSNGVQNDGIVFAALVKAPPKEGSSTLQLGPDKIPPLTTWQRLNGGIVDGGSYNNDGYYIGPAPLVGDPPGPGKFFKASRIFGQLKIGKKITKAKAIERLQKGQDVYTSSRSAAKSLMKKASGSRSFKESAHGKGFLDHFHDAWRKLKGHSFFGKPKQ